MEEVGVEAVVKGLQAFLGDMRQVNSALDGLRPSGSLLQTMFANISEAAANFGREVLNVAEVALGVMLRDAIDFVVGKLRELIDAIFEAGSEFQILQLRLERLNYNTLIESGMAFNEATKESIRLTQEQLTWIQKLAASTPYDAQDIANTYTLARAYGFTSDEAERLTQNILDFSSGMGLSNEEMSRIVINFGQLMQQGKLNAQDLKDLARGAFVPINDILAKMAENMGISVEELNKMRKAGEGGAAMVTGFMEAFNQLVEERFVGASEKMARTFKGASQNVVDLFKSILGLGVAKPILDVVGEKLASFVSAFTDNPKLWDRLVASATQLGATVADIVGYVIDVFLPASNTLAEGLISIFQGMAVWVSKNRVGIVNFFVGIRDSIVAIVGWVRDHLLPVFERILIWVTNNKGTILEFFGALGNILMGLLGDAAGVAPGGDILGGILDTVKKFMQFVIENQDKIKNWIELLLKVALAFEVLITIFNIAVGIIGAVIGWILSLVGTLMTLATIAAIVTNPILLITLGIMGLGAALGALVILWGIYWDKLKVKIADWAAETKKKIDQWFTDTWTGISTWAANTKMSIDEWATNTWTSISTWATNTWGTIIQWKDDLLSTVTEWKDKFLADVDEASNGGLTKLQFYSTETSRMFGEWLVSQATGMQGWADENNRIREQNFADSRAAYEQWIADTVASITNWGTTTGEALDTWRADEKAKSDAWWEDFKAPIADWAAATFGTIIGWKDNVLQTLEDWKNQYIQLVELWRDRLVLLFALMGADLMDSLYWGIVDGTARVVEALTWMAQRAWEAAQNVFQAHSPSQLFMDLGQNLMAGMAQGIQRYAGMAASAMTDAMQMVAAPAMIMPTLAMAYAGNGGGAGSSYNTETTNNYNLAIQSSADREPIVQDFGLLKSLQGG